MAKLNDRAVRQIRQERAAGDTYAAIAARHGVCLNTVRNVVIGKVWRHVA